MTYHGSGPCRKKFLKRYTKGSLFISYILVTRKVIEKIYLFKNNLEM